MLFQNFVLQCITKNHIDHVNLPVERGFRMLWKSPIYKFITKIGNKRKEIFIDVTGSAPTFNKPGKQLEGTFKVLLNGLKPKDTTILDFGAAKLRNTVYLLEKGFTVYSCEFDDLFKRSQQAKEFLDIANGYSNFKRLIFPDGFVTSTIKFDVILLINVLNVMPVPIERLCVAYLCKEKMKKNGRLLWYTQHGTYSYEDAVAPLNDGIITGKGRKYHMFYRDFSRKEIHDLLKSTGFSYNKNFTFPASGSNQAYVFNTDGDVLVDETLGLTKLLKSSLKKEFETIERKAIWEGEDKSKKVSYQAEVPKTLTKLNKIDILETYLKQLSKIPPGKTNAHKYHELIFNILKSTFDYCLKNPQMEEVMASETQRVDITFSNHRETGFFKQLAEGYNIPCPNIFIECKNFTKDIANVELAQIKLRLNKTRGNFGIVICRHIKNKSKLKSRVDDLIKDEKYVIVLDDNDIIKIGKLKLREQEDEIDDYLEEKFKKLI